jgi:hypothetical protein
VDPAIESTRALLRRVRLTAIGAYVVFIIPVLIMSGARGVVGLTCSALVTMINFLWLEEIVRAIVQPTRRPAWRLSLRPLARFALLGAALTVTIVIARFNVVSVLLGFSIIVVGIMGEAVYALVHGDAAS